MIINKWVEDIKSSLNSRINDLLKKSEQIFFNKSLF